MDLITYVPDLVAMGEEAREIAQDEDNPLTKLFTLDEDGVGVTFNVTKIPVVFTKDNETLCLCRGMTRDMLNGINSIDVLGECLNKEYIFDSPEAEDTYYEVRPLEYTYMDEEGNEQIGMLPKQIGVFA